MRVLICAIFMFLAACGPQIGVEPTQVEYRITPKDSGFQLEISHNGRYLNKQSHFIIPKPKNPSDRVSHFVLQKDYFQLAGSNFLKCMGVDPTHKKSIRIIWNAPVGWKFASSFPEQAFEANCYDLMDAIYVGGDAPTFSIRKTQFGTLALMGSFPNLQISHLEEALKINMARVEKFWEPSSKPGSYHLVSIRNLNSKKYSGSAHFQSFQLDLPSSQQKGLELDHLITHEYFHNWNPQQYNSNQHVDILWFTEGFTDYFAYWLVYRNSPRDYLQTFQNKDFKNVDMHELKRNHKNNHDYFFVPYIQGRRVAANFDEKIYSYSGKRLENVMHDLIHRSKNPGFLLTQENIFKVICEGNYMPCDQAKKIYETYVLNGTELEPVTQPLI